MYPVFETILFVVLLASAVIALQVKDLLAAVVTLGVFSFVSALIYISMGAVDVGFTEAVVGAGITTVLFIVAIYHTQRKSID
jgi:energy-converting hydrogenase B subunit D